MDLQTLNKEQKSAVTAPLGPVLVLAGAGSGKTRVLTYRIAYLITHKVFKPSEILAVTFTNKAAKEMQERVGRLLGSPKTAETPTMGTFHSVGMRILRKEIARIGYSPSFSIIDDEDRLKLLKDIIKNQQIPEQFSATLFRAEISRAKNELMTPANVNLPVDGRLLELIQRVYAEYQNQMMQSSLVDFDDLLMLPVKIFENFPEVLEKYRNKFRYILVDEYQDTNKVQYVFLQMLAHEGNIFVVGDDAQSIYKFRGSTIRNILDFESDHPGAQVYKLEQNYRSSKHILAAAGGVIRLNVDQKEKELWTENEAGHPVWIEEVNNERSEAVFVVKKIIALATDTEHELYASDEEDPLAEANKPFSILDQYLKKSPRAMDFDVPRLPLTHEPLSDYAVLFRTHAQSRALEEAFIAAGIPYQIVGGVKFYERKEIKDLLAYLRLIHNPRDIVSLKRVVNVPPRGIGEKSFELLAEFLKTLWSDAVDPLTPRDISKAIVSSRLTPKQRDAATIFFSDLAFFSETEDHIKLSELLKLVVKRTGFERYLKDKTEAGEERYENVQEFISVASSFDNAPLQSALEAFLEEVALMTDIDTKVDTKDSVTLMTLHAAKGLEFDTVFFVGLEEGLLPHSRSLFDPEELAEEIRLAYVGLTRAKKRLFLIFARSRTIFGSTQSGIPSRILKALPKESVYTKAGSLLLEDGELSYEAID